MLMRLVIGPAAATTVSELRWIILAYILTYTPLESIPKLRPLMNTLAFDLDKLLMFATGTTTFETFWDELRPAF